MKKILTAAVAGVVLLVGGVFVYFNFIRDDAPPAFELTDTAQADDTADDTDDGDGGQDSSGDAADGQNDAGAQPVGDGLDGTWVVADGSEAGYRVVEDLSNIQDFEAVGRTPRVTGSIVINGTTVTEGSFTVPVADISSDDRRRDGQFANDIMNSQEFPEATLVLTGPIGLEALPAEGTVVSTAADGELTLRGVTNPVSIDVSAQRLGNQIEIVASIGVLFSDYGIDNPTNAFVTVRDEGTVEALLLLSLQ